MKFKNKPFDLDEFQKDRNRKIVTRDGNKVVIVGIDILLPQPVVGYFITEKGNPSHIQQWGSKGKYYNTIEESTWDLFFAPTIKTEYVALEPHNNYNIDARFKSAEDAKQHCIDDNLILGTLTYEI